MYWTLGLVSQSFCSNIPTVKVDKTLKTAKSIDAFFILLLASLRSVQVLYNNFHHLTKKYCWYNKKCKTYYDTWKRSITSQKTHTPEHPPHSDQFLIHFRLIFPLSLFQLPFSRFPFFQHCPKTERQIPNSVISDYPTATWIEKSLT